MPGGPWDSGARRECRVHEKRVWRFVGNKLKPLIFLKKHYRIF